MGPTELSESLEVDFLTSLTPVKKPVIKVRNGDYTGSRNDSLRSDYTVEGSFTQDDSW